MKKHLSIPGKPRSKRGIPVAKYTPLKPEDQAKYDAWLAEFGRLDAIKEQYASAARFSCQGIPSVKDGDVFALNSEFTGLVPRQTIVAALRTDLSNFKVILVPRSPFSVPVGRWEYGLEADEGNEVYQVWNSYSVDLGTIFNHASHLGCLNEVQCGHLNTILDQVTGTCADSFKDPELLKRVGAPEQSGPELAQYFNTERRGKVV